MKLLNLKLRGSIGIQKGLGLDEVEVDMTNFAPGLIALTGKNGAGKTTIMENLHPYRTMVSRTGSLQSHFYLKDSYRILEFEHNGDIYESKILIDALTNGSEAYLICNGKPLNDGKLTTYDEAIELVLGSQDLFFNSVFSGQKSKGIAELKPADRRKLFYELLALNQYDLYLEDAKAKLKVEENNLARIEGEISGIDVSAETKKTLEFERVEALNRQAELVSKIIDIEERLAIQKKIDEKLKIEIAKLEERLNANVEIEQKIKEAKENIEKLTNEFEGEKESSEATISVFENEIKRLEQLTISSKEVDEKILERKKIEAELSIEKELLSRLISENSEIQANFNLQTIAFNERKEAIAELKSQIERKSRSIKDTTDKIEKIRENSKIIEEVPCDEVTGRTCKFLKNAYADAELIESLTKLLENDVEDYEIAQNEFDIKKTEYNSEVELFQISKNDATNRYNELKESADSKIKKLTEKLTQLNTLNLDETKNEINSAENEIKIINGKIANVIELIERATKNYNNSLGNIKKEANELQNKLDLQLPKTIDLKIHELQTTIISITNLTQILESVKQDWESVNDELNYRVAELQRIARDEVRLSELSKKRDAIHKEITDWAFLVKAFDKTGIPVLKLENSGIEITSVANELLSLFENKFRIVFETTKLKADKKSYKESFDINIVEEDGVCEIGNKSGGQQVWLETAIQSAISLVVRKQGRNIQTSFLDEKDGALDLDNAFSYIEMLRKAHEMSGVHNTFIITHRPELLDFIPQQIKLSDGYLSILN